MEGRKKGRPARECSDRTRGEADLFPARPAHRGLPKRFQAGLRAGEAACTWRTDLKSSPSRIAIQWYAEDFARLPLRGQRRTRSITWIGPTGFPFNLTPAAKRRETPEKHALAQHDGDASSTEPAFAQLLRGRLTATLPANEQVPRARPRKRLKREVR